MKKILYIIFVLLTITSKAQSSSLCGIHKVYVQLISKKSKAKFAKKILSPEGTHYVKISAKQNGLQIQFCNKNGVVSTEDYHYKTTNHFWRNKMPMALNLYNLKIKYNESTGAITQGEKVIVKIGKNGKNKLIGWMVLDSKKQSSDNTARVIKTLKNTKQNFTIKIVLGLELPFDCWISKQTNIHLKQN